MGAPERTVSAQPFIPESALTGPEITRQLLLKEVGHAPPIEAIIAVFLAEPDPAEIASSLLSQAIAMRYDDAKQGQIRLPAVPDEFSSPPGELGLQMPALSAPSDEIQPGFLPTGRR